MTLGTLRKSAMIAACIVAATGAAMAHPGASGVVKERMDAMDDMARHVKAVAGMLRGSAEMDSELVRASAKALVDHANKIPDLFPTGSDAPVSEVKMEIWHDWSGFVSEADRLRSAAQAMGTSAETGELDAVAASFNEVGQSCSSCHEAYRLKK